jgi:hypothetical protein
MSSSRPHVYQPKSGLIVTISWEFLDKHMEFSYITALLIIATQPRPKICYKVDIGF